MAELDFTALNKLAYKGFETAEEREHKDELIEKGYTYLPDEKTPFDPPPSASETPQTVSAPQTVLEPQTEITETPPQPQQATDIPAQAKPTTKKQVKPFKSLDGETDYKELYKEIQKYHEKYTPPELDLTGGEGGYWWRAGVELTQLNQKYKGNKFATDLLLLVFTELETEYKKLRDRQTASGG